MKKALKCSALNKSKVYCRMSFLLTDSHYIVILSLCSLFGTIRFFRNLSPSLRLTRGLFPCRSPPSLPHSMVAPWSCSRVACPLFAIWLRAGALSASPPRQTQRLSHSSAKPFTSSGPESVIRTTACCASGRK